MNRPTAVLVSVVIASGLLVTPAGASGADRANPTTNPATNQATKSSALHWHKLTQAGDSPPGRDYEVVNDRAHHRLVAFGGFVGDTLLSGTWVWQGGSWSELETHGAPSHRADYGLAYDAARQEVVLFGGWSSGEAGDDNETWVLSDDTWTQRTPAVSPPASRWSAMTYDPVRQEVVMYTGNIPTGDTWTWDGTSWTKQVSVKNPYNDLYFFEMAWDASRQAVILYGGDEDHHGDFWLSGETWAWDGKSWIQLRSGPPRAQFALASFGRHVVMFGGVVDESGTRSDETWILRDRGWVQLDLSRRPSPRTQAELVPTGHRRLLLVGGYGDDTAKVWRLQV